MSTPVDLMPTGGIPRVLPVTVRHWLPFLGLGTMPNTIIDESTSFIPPSLHIEAFLTS